MYREARRGEKEDTAIAPRIRAFGAVQMSAWFQYAYFRGSPQLHDQRRCGGNAFSYGVERRGMASVDRGRSGWFGTFDLS
jgi:hypothetical protein